MADVISKRVQQMLNETPAPFTTSLSTAQEGRANLIRERDARNKAKGTLGAFSKRASNSAVANIINQSTTMG